MNDSFGAGGFNATAGGGGAGNENKAEGVLPLVIEQVLESSDGGISLFGHQYAMITLVAIIRNVDYSSTKVTYQLEDHTGRIDAHLWIEDDGVTSTPSIVPQSYARVVGSVRNQGGSKSIMIFKIDQINSPNEVTTHLLEVLHARYKGEENSKRKVEGGFDTNANATSNGGFMESDSVGASLGLNGKQLAVYKAIKSHVSDIGISRKELQAKFSHISPSEMQSIIDHMGQEGMIYTTVDTDHFFCVDA
ncbi:replication protein A 32 kDa subunit [Anopheles arabiensis]|uniref:AGAP008332-PA n=3 Tax=gambiae species complex TaxID=44542 RepID=Q7PNC3_ANOGA|nr:replication protein A 32 kDa subunit [Anopheles arabiensis]XP_040238138.1 replication protein A 32 kDa subunit [Anopheles coluzzii]XP_041776919.1 replication protein A 32 kDa subunit [Anopheles merus]XP_061513685.1 replication protein A 32 kDa subunit [Anopheles gambiae]EAA12428.4 AGAP008332-PA [Anopheles gambiae str. PEST]